MDFTVQFRLRKGETPDRDIVGLLAPHFFYCLYLGKFLDAWNNITKEAQDALIAKAHRNSAGIVLTPDKMRQILSRQDHRSASVARQLLEGMLSEVKRSWGVERPSLCTSEVYYTGSNNTANAFLLTGPDPKAKVIKLDPTEDLKIILWCHFVLESGGWMFDPFNSTTDIQAGLRQITS